MRVVAVVLVSFVLLVAAMAIEVVAGPYRMDVKTDPSVIPVGRANIVFHITDSAKNPAAGLTVSAMASMPGMSMGEKEQIARPGDSPGTYVVPVAFSMAGKYEVKVSVNGPQGPAKTTISLATGQDTSGATGGQVWWAWVLVLGALAFVVFRMRRTGQNLHVSGLLNLQVLGAVILLALALGIATWAVRTQRRPGAMTPLEAQAMEMTTPAPEGTLPVTLATATRGPFRATVHYSGQAVGFVEQDIVPRVTGAIVSMPVYVGSVVKRGQVLARLDTSSLDPEVAMKSATVGRAQQGVGVAALEHQEALASIAQARAEVSMAEGGVAEARAMLDAAEQSKAGAEAEVEAAKADVQGLDAEVSAAEAERDYAQDQAERLKRLLDQGYVSRTDYDRARADASKAAANVRKTIEDRRQSEQRVVVAQAAVRKASAEVTGARRRIQQAESSVKAKQATVRTAEKSAAAARARIGQESSTVRESVAALKGTTTQLGFATLRAETDGVVTARLVSPGQVVAPGQAVLRVAQVRPIRLQVNVPTEDLVKIKIGSPVKVTAGDTVWTLRVSSVGPSLDGTARTGVVEAVFDNEDGAVRPGQYVTMELEVGSASNVVSVPTDAIDQRGTKPFVWVATESSGDDFTLERREVELGLRSQNSVEVRSGLSQGERVLVSPPFGLSPSTRVTEVAKEAVTSGPTVKVTSNGYEPPSLTIPSDKEVTITFLRTTKGTCGTEVIIKALGINEPLPLNVPVKVKIPPQPPGEIRFTCAMDMLDGKVTVK